MFIVIVIKCIKKKYYINAKYNGQKIQTILDTQTQSYCTWKKYHLREQEKIDRKKDIADCRYAKQTRDSRTKKKWLRNENRTRFHPNTILNNERKTHENIQWKGQEDSIRHRLDLSTAKKTPWNRYFLFSYTGTRPTQQNVFFRGWILLSRRETEKRIIQRQLQIQGKMFSLWMCLFFDTRVIK